MLEVFRVVMTNCDEDQHFVVGGAEQVPWGLWHHAPSELAHWPAGTTLAKLHRGGARAGVAAVARHADGCFTVTDAWATPSATPRCSSPVDQRVRLALGALKKTYPDVDIARHIIGDPITVSWEADENFLGAFKGRPARALPVQPADVRALRAGRFPARATRDLPGR
ncbi:hypothetical protein [Blastococcus sp. SYSU DS0973]